MAPKANDVVKPTHNRPQRSPAGRTREPTKPTPSPRRNGNPERGRGDTSIKEKHGNQKEKFNNIMEKLNRLEIELDKKQKSSQREKNTVRRRKHRSERNESMERPPSRPRSATNLKTTNELSVWPDIKACNHSADESPAPNISRTNKKVYSNKRPLAPLSIFHKNFDNKDKRPPNNHKTYPKVETSKFPTNYKTEQKENHEKSKRTVLDFTQKSTAQNYQGGDRTNPTYQTGSNSRPITPKQIQNSYKIVSGKFKGNNAISNDFSESVNSESVPNNRGFGAHSEKSVGIYHTKMTSKSKKVPTNSLSASSRDNKQGNVTSKKLAEANLSGSTDDSGIGKYTNQISEVAIVHSKYYQQSAKKSHVKYDETIEPMQEDFKHDQNRFTGNNCPIPGKRREESINASSANITDAKLPNNSPRKGTTNNEDGYNKVLKNYSPTTPAAKLINAAVKYDLTTVDVKVITSQQREASSQEFVSGNFSDIQKKELLQSNKLSNDNIYCKDNDLEEKFFKNSTDVRDCLKINKLPAFRKALAKLTQEYDDNMDAVVNMRNKSKDYTQLKHSSKIDKNGNYKKSNPKRRESTSPDEGISYSPDTDNSPTCPRKGSNVASAKENHNGDNSHILIDIKGGAMRSSRPHRSSRKSKHVGDNSKPTKDESSKRSNGSKSKYSNRSGEKTSKSRTKPVWVEISKESKPTPEKHNKNNYEFHVPKSYKIQPSTDKYDRKQTPHKEPVALEINYKAKFIQSKLQSELNKNKKKEPRETDTTKNGYEKSDNRTKRTRGTNVEENRRVLRHREPNKIKASKTRNHVDYERKARHKSLERSISVDSSITDLSYSSTSSSSYNSSSERADSSSSSYSSSILTSSTHSHSSGSYITRSQPKNKKEVTSAKTQVTNRPKARSDERHSRTKSSSLIDESRYADKAAKRGDKSRNNNNYRTKAKSHRRPEDTAQEAAKRLSDENQVFETQLGSRRNRSKRDVNNEEDKSRSNWQHQRLVMTSIRPGDLQPQSKPPLDKPRAGKDSREAHKSSKTFEATTKDSNGSVLTIRDLYSLHHVLSDTQNGTVIAGHRRSDGMRVAIKRIAKSGTTRWGWMGGKVVPLELALICQVNEVRHSGVVEIVEWHETTEAFLLVMVRPHPSVDLYDHVTKQKRLKESVARSIIVQLISSLSHCHKYGVLHRDVKLENILFNPVTNETILIDFGCGDFHRHGPYKEFAGTPEYYPPEWFVCKQYTGESATVWSIGVLLFALLCGTLPFRSSKDITQKEITKFPSDVSNSARELISTMLKKNPRDRIEMKKVLDFKWFNSTSSDKSSSRKTSV